MIGGAYMKEYWGEGSTRARNWQRYDLGGASKLNFEEGVDYYVTYAGSQHDNVEASMYKVKSTMCNVGVTNIPDLMRAAKLPLVSSVSIVEGGAHDVTLRNKKAASRRRQFVLRCSKHRRMHARLLQHSKIYSRKRKACRGLCV